MLDGDHRILGKIGKFYILSKQMSETEISEILRMEKFVNISHFDIWTQLARCKLIPTEIWRKIQGRHSV